VTDRILLAGNNLAAVETLDVLLDAWPAERLLVLAPDPSARPSWHHSLAEHARRRGVEALMPEDANDPAVVSAIAGFEPQLLLSVYYVQLFRAELLAAIDGPALNFHPSLLPRHRGTAPIVWAIAEGDTMTGLSVHHIDAGIDTGRVVLQRPLPIHRDDTGYDVHRKMARLVYASAAELVRRYLLGGDGVPAGEEQRGEASYHSLRDPQLNHIDWSQSAERVRNVVRALAPPLPGAYGMLDGERLVLAAVESALGPRERPRPHGMVELPYGQRPLVWAADGPVAITSFVDHGANVDGRELPERPGVEEGAILG
jgi:methionyl-tRNA formyltransferase